MSFHILHLSVHTESFHFPYHGPDLASYDLFHACVRLLHLQTRSSLRPWFCPRTRDHPVAGDFDRKTFPDRNFPGHNFPGNNGRRNGHNHSCYWHPSFHRHRPKDSVIHNLRNHILRNLEILEILVNHSPGNRSLKNHIHCLHTFHFRMTIHN